ncbi:MAG: FAD-binding protein [Gemmatimonadota bacterium]|nr:FAD-binding protein [Gemmatimonadota bacterium]
MRGDAAVAEFVRDSAAKARRLRIVGCNTWLDAGSPVTADARLSMADDSGIVSYVPDDLTVTARAGTTLRDLADALAVNDQWIALDPEGGSDASLGATVATCSYGPAAALFGTPRDQVLGLTVVTGTGDIVHAGGHVVKNVAGFDLTRLMIGAWGTLGVITEICIRVRSRSMRADSMAHMRRAMPSTYGYRAPVMSHPRLAAALKERFDPAGILNPGIMLEPS